MPKAKDIAEQAEPILQPVNFPEYGITVMAVDISDAEKKLAFILKSNKS